MRKVIAIILLVTLCGSAFALTGEEIIGRVDDNRVYSSIEYEATMTIAMGSQVREKRFAGFSQGDRKAYLEFTSPARDKGTRFLKLGEEMWMYIPAVEKATKIAGHMLRQSLMGSDFSYDDFTENERMEDLYSVELIGMDTVAEKSCYELELIAKVDEVSYYKRKVWVTEETFIPIRTELYAKSGKLMKEFFVLETRKVGRYSFPVRMRMESKLRKDTFTEIVFDKIKLDVVIPAHVFTRAYVERK